MREGWQGESYLILFEASETAEISRRHDIGSYIVDQGATTPGHGNRLW